MTGASLRSKTFIKCVTLVLEYLMRIVYVEGVAVRRTEHPKWGNRDGYMYVIIVFTMYSLCILNMKHTVYYHINPFKNVYV